MLAAAKMNGEKALYELKESGTPKKVSIKAGKESLSLDFLQAAASTDMLALVQADGSIWLSGITKSGQIIDGLSSASAGFIKAELGSAGTGCHQVELFETYALALTERGDLYFTGIAPNGSAVYTAFTHLWSGIASIARGSSTDALIIYQDGTFAKLSGDNWPGGQLVPVGASYP
jgi:alpha-tubulin suppressor-like RCC1 family protein